MSLKFFEDMKAAIDEADETGLGPEAKKLLLVQWLAGLGVADFEMLLQVLVPLSPEGLGVLAGYQALDARQRAAVRDMLNSLHGKDREARRAGPVHPKFLCTGTINHMADSIFIVNGVQQEARS